ncbi:MAG: hypothetical protein KDD81_11125, partial [Rhodobacteraceae bacterium]|nr:hypothetical protein [Paracoccaceae bacterium]
GRSVPNRQRPTRHQQPNEGDRVMLRTIVIGTCVQVQGTLEKELDNGRILIRVGNKVFEGLPVTKKAA